MQQLQNRPSSAYYNNNAGGNSSGYVLNHTAPATASTNQMNATFSHPNLAQSAVQQLQQQQQQQMRNNRNFTRESQGQQSLRSAAINQMMAPSMPNIAHSSGYASNIQASQSMQNVNAIPPQGYQNGGGGGAFMGQPYMPSDHPHQRPPIQQNFAPRGSSLKGQEMINDMISRRTQPAHSSMEHISGYPGAGGSYQQQQQQQPPQQQQPHPSPQRQQNFAFPPNRTMSPMRQLPPTAPKPVHRHHDEPLSPPLPPTSTHPLYSKQPTQGGSNNYVASLNEPPKGALYPNNPNAPSKHVTASANPWEREEREKELETRREQARLWRDQQIAELSSTPNRNGQQEEQLKTLQLDRDFERRAMEEQAEDDNEGGFLKDNSVQEVLRLTTQANHVNRLKAVDIRSPSSLGSAVTTAIDSPRMAASPVPPVPIVQPKSILKHNPAASNPSSPSKAKVVTASYIDKSQNLTELTINNTNANQYITQMSKNMTQLNMNEDVDNVIDETKISPPPPPERNSSYLIMAQQQQQQKLKSNAVNAVNNNNTIPRQSVGYNPSYVANVKNNNVLPPLSTGPLSPSAAEVAFTGASTSQMANYSFKDNKRVSFHDEDNNVIATPSINAESGVSGIGQAELAIIREDPNVS